MMFKIHEQICLTKPSYVEPVYIKKLSKASTSFFFFLSVLSALTSRVWSGGIPTCSSLKPWDGRQRGIPLLPNSCHYPQFQMPVRS